MTLYLMTEPLAETLKEFMDLGQQLYSLGRFHLHRHAHLSGPHQWLDAHAAPRVRIAAETLPYRPNRGIYVTVEEPKRDVEPTELLDWVQRWHESWAGRWAHVEGVSGSWSFATSPSLRSPRWTTGDRRITVHYLDGDPLEVAEPRQAAARRAVAGRAGEADPRWALRDRCPLSVGLVQSEF